MPQFDTMFLQSQGQPIQYKERTLHRADRIPIPDGSVFYVLIEQTASRWRQGIDIVTKGSFEVNGDVAKKGFYLWADTAPNAPERIPIVVHTSDGLVRVNNVWMDVRGTIEAWHNGAAMWVEELPNGRRYHCNDGDPDDDFDDIIFSILLS